MELNELYQEVLLDHNKRPRNYGSLPEATHNADAVNPLCGDEVHLHLVVDGDTISDVRFEGSGCAISVASASMLTETIKGMKVEEVRDLAKRFRDVLVEKKQDDLGDLEVFTGVQNFPMRVKCATMAWHTAVEALEGV